MTQDTNGWEKQTNPNEYKGEYFINKTDGTDQVKAIATVVTDKSSGDFTVYEDNGLLPGIGSKLYNYSAVTGNIAIEDKVAFDSMFDGVNSHQFDTVNKNTKKATLALAKEAIKFNDPTSKGYYDRIINTRGYESLGKNTSSFNPNEVNNDLSSDPGVSLGAIDSPNKVQEQSFSVGGTSDLLRYPRQSLEAFGYDYIQITAFEYEVSGLGGGKGKATGFKGSGSNPRFKKPYETIQLPMQPALSESLGVSWGEDQLNAIKAAGAGLAGGLAQGATSLGLDKESTKAAGEKLKNAMADGMSFINDDASAEFVAAYFAGQAVGSDVTARSTGTVINPNLELLFKGPQLRSFNFNFILTPRDREEARTCRKIIRAMKRNMTPQRSESTLFLKTPRIFKLEYIYGEGNTPHPFMNKFKPCACTNFSVNYTPDGSYMTYAGEPSMTSYQISMAFGEIEPIYADEYGAQGGSDEAQTMGF